MPATSLAASFVTTWNFSEKEVDGAGDGSGKMRAKLSWNVSRDYK